MGEWLGQLCRFRPVHYAPALGFLMFAVGVNLKPSQFAECFQRPEVHFLPRSPVPSFLVVVNNMLQNVFPSVSVSTASWVCHMLPKEPLDFATT